MDTLSVNREPNGEETFVTAAQSTLPGLWAKVLEVDDVAPEDNFILLGGDSLRAAILFAEIDSLFGVSLPLDVIYDEGETFSEMAALIDHCGYAPSMPPERKGKAPRERRRPLPLGELGDVTTAITLLGLGAICWLPSTRIRTSICRQVARAHIALRGSRAEELSGALPSVESYDRAGDLERDIVAGGHEEMTAILRGYLPWSRPPKVRLKGGANLDRAMTAGKGAVLWRMPGAPGSRAGSLCLAGHGVQIAQLRSYAHPYSSSRIGIRFLNPVANRISDRNVKATAVLHEENGAEIMEELGSYLSRNMAVGLSANGSSGTPYEMPFLEGTLCLALGAPALALLHNAPLLPAICVPDGAGGFDYIIESPLTDHSDRPPAERARALAKQYAEILEYYVKRHPQIWRCWFMRKTWRPGL